MYMLLNMDFVNKNADKMSACNSITVLLDSKALTRNLCAHVHMKMQKRGDFVRNVTTMKWNYDQT